MIDARSRNEFWKVVERCMIELLDIPPEKARTSWVELSRHVESVPNELASEIFFHAEPYDVACDLAGVEPTFSQHRSAYHQILAQHKW